MTYHISLTTYHSNMELDKRFDFKTVDAKWTAYWEKNNCFHATPSDKKPYVITIPPPNVTGILHMGHALNNTLQDILIRYKRMQGFETCWMPGTDHAGIATQNVVEKQLAKEGTNRHAVGREKLLQRLWEWKQQYGDTIINQLKAIGASCDWPRAAFTMDEQYSEAVKKVFIELYKKDLIYQGERIINWCPRCRTALSDEESEHEEKQGTLTHIKYPLKDDPNQFITVATTRPETMLGDTAVAVHPNDERYKNLHGKTLILPILRREIPIITDEFVDPTFGSGAVKVTPAHDPNDFDMGRRHNLKFIRVMNEDGTMNEQAGPFAGQDRFVARKGVLEALKNEGVFVKQEDHTHSVGHCYRCHSIVEPYLSKQWFVRMEPLARPAIEAVRSGEIKFHPARWEKVYMNWMENIRDWCISRQIWWGHRIPVWYDEQGNPYAANNEEEAIKLSGKKNLRQDEDVLDTWFSSWLWPFATFGYPNKNKDLEFFYPGDALFTASEIIFFWVARMIMAGYEFMGDLPFKDVFIHGTVRDAQGRKMSKSLGNAIDPLEIVDEYGADALRFSLIHNSGQDLYISKDNFEVGRNFANKIWNASRLILMNVESRESKNTSSLVPIDGDLASKWIVSRFYSTLKNVEEAIENFRYSEAEHLIYEFFWTNLCDWYFEIIKSQNRWNEPAVQRLVVQILEESLKMMHPFIPFVTEEIWEHLNKEKGPLCLQDWPKVNQQFINAEIESDMQQYIMNTTIAIRDIRATRNIPLKKNIPVSYDGETEDIERFLKNQDIVTSLTNSTVSLGRIVTVNCATAIVGKITLTVPLENLIDNEAEKNRIQKQMDTATKSYDSLKNRLSNESFLAKAPEDVVKKEQERLKTLEHEITEFQNVLKNLK
ncbi:MAG: valine--tRNA ligase [Candidatus Omnitrophica bacterium]|nr:valine--tRNA ligase [Candidatus Omnitrophota bacterium]